MPMNGLRMARGKPEKHGQGQRRSLAINAIQSAMQNRTGQITYEDHQTRSMLCGLVRWKARIACVGDPFGTCRRIGQPARHLMPNMAVLSMVVKVNPAVEMDMGPAAGIMSPLIGGRKMAMRSRRPLQEQL